MTATADMPEYTGTWSPEEVRAFLRETTVPLRLGCRTPAGHPWMLSLWYEHVDVTDDAGALELRCATGADADVLRYLRADPAVAFEVSTNDPPYRGVRGRGTTSLEPDEGKAQLRSLLERYLGGTDSALARRLLAPEREEVCIRILPERVHSWDYSPRMREFGDEP